MSAPSSLIIAQTYGGTIGLPGIGIWTMVNDSTDPVSGNSTSSLVGIPSLGQLPLGGTYTALHLGHFWPTNLPNATFFKNLVVANPAV